MFKTAKDLFLHEASNATEKLGKIFIFNLSISDFLVAVSNNIWNFFAVVLQKNVFGQATMFYIKFVS